MEKIIDVTNTAAQVASTKNDRTLLISLAVTVLAGLAFIAWYFLKRQERMDEAKDIVTKEVVSCVTHNTEIIRQNTEVLEEIKGLLGHFKQYYNPKGE